MNNTKKDVKTEEQLLETLVLALNKLKEAHALIFDTFVALGNMTTHRAGEHDWAFMAGLTSASAKAVGEIGDFLEKLDIIGIARHQEGSHAEAEGTVSSEERHAEGN